MSETHEQNPESTDSSQLIQRALIVILIIGVGLLIARSVSTPKETTTEPQTESSSEAKPNVSAPPPAATTTAPTKTLTITSAAMVESFADRAKAEETINKNQAKKAGTDEYESIISGIVTDEAHPTFAYFATRSNNGFVGVYRYELPTMRWQRLHKGTYTTQSLRVVGLDKQSLVLRLDPTQTTFERCDSLLLPSLKSKTAVTLKSLDLSSASTTLSDYTLSETNMTVSKDLQTACLAK